MVWWLVILAPVLEDHAALLEPLECLMASLERDVELLADLGVAGFNNTRVRPRAMAKLHDA